MPVPLLLQILPAFSPFSSPPSRQLQIKQFLASHLLIKVFALSTDTDLIPPGETVRANRVKERKGEVV